MIADIPVAEIPTIDQLLDWLREPARDGENRISEELAHISYLTMHPRHSWLKNLPANSTVLDVGAGSGQLVNFRDWLAFSRNDLSFFGASLAEGQYTHKYDEFIITNIEAKKPQFSRPPNAIMMAHFIEHMRDPEDILKWACELLPTGGRIYVEWPGPNTVFLPSRQQLLEKGYQNITTINFYDDGTHLNPHGIRELGMALDKHGISIRSAGYVDLPYLADVLRDAGLRKQPEGYLLSVAIWLKTLFSSYVSGIKR